MQPVNSLAEHFFKTGKNRREKRPLPSSERWEVGQGSTTRSAMRGAHAACDKSHRALTLPAPWDPPYIRGQMYSCRDAAINVTQERTTAAARNRSPELSFTVCLAQVEVQVWDLAPFSVLNPWSFPLSRGGEEGMAAHPLKLQGEGEPRPKSKCRRCCLPPSCYLLHSSRHHPLPLGAREGSPAQSTGEKPGSHEQHKNTIRAFFHCTTRTSI